jgi:hypothetical protein
MARRIVPPGLPGSFTEKWPAKTPADGSYVAEDLFSVTRIPGGFQVKHYADEDAPACCNLSVEITDGDRVGALSSIDAEMNALHRVCRVIDAKHGRRTAGAAA